LTSIKLDFLGLFIYVYDNFERLLYFYFPWNLQQLTSNGNYKLRVKILRFIS